MVSQTHQEKVHSPSRPAMSLSLSHTDSGSAQSSPPLHVPPQTLPTQSDTSSSTSSTTPRRLDAAHAADMRMARCSIDIVNAVKPLMAFVVFSCRSESSNK